MRKKTIYPKGTTIVINALKDGRLEVVANSPPHTPKKKRLAEKGLTGNNNQHTGSLGNQPGSEG